ncbi:MULTISPECIES: ABC transporter permease [unclassified Rhizobium]|uniref:ABC transporter permease n=1 Tax=unclassified Rhizobium TaxID=2613769 RepID=UPI00160BA5D1|nr:MULTISPECIES: ABC transporter permease [unclassified Rhizobium]MBB3541292.1 ABC-2 type transport system permease protein [Rhizobium sp. BK399]MCS3740017.1 ABC-2 type transport system permease protein [Rhizobium sp. BK661]MCS4092033.1 ABC-2 type transport system permease protein [Rhizobium sp. BK176]
MTTTNGHGISFGRFWAMTIKEFIQMTRDRITLATMVALPIMQLFLFGFAINTTPHNLPTAVLMRENTDVGRSILAALANTDFFEIRSVVTRAEDMDSLLESGKVLFVVEIPEGFERSLRRGDTPSLLVAADATDPVASSSALGALSGIVTSALVNDRQVEFTEPTKPAFSIVQHRRYNPAGSSTLNIVPGLLGTILTMTLLIFTALSVTREVERGTMENLLSMPIKPLEIMLGKITPYVLIGLVQSLLIITAGLLVFGVPILGNPASLAAATTLFVITNLSIGYTFSTIAANQLQAMQMAMMFFLPNILLSGFMFPFAGMPKWAQWIGEALPLTHYIRIVRAIMLKGASIETLAYDTIALACLMGVAMLIAVRRFRRTLD